ncbi:methylated-DNA--protein-cysteine methyltransferase [Pseudoclavibacter endophyticus]|uniref:Methyltransferase n=1 Tax=Pseudoclavibacter endophyticus TaxID=1778590 RepID=A0A6H9WFS3_9MICO|nr:MGMT family protein [Pseudoclavibacter endophyticus]KAB1649752.1 methyltransferase [Pseudoclavibacter endophyticus]GGA60037.1 methylated-DNA--protein-cysteine methyltransferase [Pseudoclavibacter endophyticus]
MASGWDRYLDAVRLVPPGRVATYGTIAVLAGSPRAARQVGYALASVSEDAGVPWHRVVGRRGRDGIGISLAGPGGELQRTLLGDEGVDVDDAGRIAGGREWFGEGG